MNALSEEFVVTSYRDGKGNSAFFNKGELVKKFLSKRQKKKMVQKLSLLLIQPSSIQTIDTFMNLLKICCGTTHI